MDRKVTKATEMLKAARLKKGYSQQQVAVIAGVHVRQYQRLEYGERAMKSMTQFLTTADPAPVEPETGLTLEERITRLEERVALLEMEGVG